MGIYLGSSEKLNINVKNVLYGVEVMLTAPVLNKNILMSLDHLLLKDSNGLYLVAKEGK